MNLLNRKNGGKFYSPPLTFFKSGLYAILLVMLFYVLPAKGQSTCGTAVLMPLDTSITYQMNDSVFWIRFVTTDTSSYSIKMLTPTQTPAATIIDINLYSGNCAGLTKIGYADADNGLEIYTSSLLNNQTYYIKIRRSSSGSEYFSIMNKKRNKSIWNIANCPPVNCGLVYNRSINPIDINNYDIDIPMQNYDVCGWLETWGTPSLGIESNNFYSVLYSRFDGVNPNGEGMVSAIINMNAGINYQMTLDYRENLGTIDNFIVCLVDDNAFATPTIHSSTEIIPAFSSDVIGVISPIHDNSWHTININFTAGARKRICIYPVQNQFHGGWAVLNIDNVDISKQSTISGNTSACQSPSTYNIVDVIPNTTYTWSITPANAGTIIANNNTSVTIEWNNSNFNACPANATIRADYCNTFSTLEVFKCCLPDGTYTILDNATITTNITPNTTYLIRGTLTIDGNITFWSSNSIIMDRDAKIDIPCGSLLTINGSSINSICHMWDGIYLHCADSRLTINNNTNIEDAKNAIVAELGAYVDIYNSTFDNNFIHNIYKNYTATGSAPIKISKTNYTCTQTLKSPLCNIRSKIGIYSDNVNKIFIGDTTTFANRNSFSGADTLIKCLNANVTIYNNRFTNTANQLNQIGVYASNSDAATQRTLIVGDTNTSTYKKSNLFSTLDYAIKVYKNYNVTVKGDSILTSFNNNMNSYGVHIYDCPNRNVYLMKNFLQGQRYGLFVLDIGDANVIVSNNKVYNFLKGAIYICNTVSCGVKKLLVLDNLVRNLASNIFLSYSFNSICVMNIDLPTQSYPPIWTPAKIERNQVAIFSPITTVPIINGIHVANCVQPTINTNTVWQRGTIITLTDSTNAKKIRGINVEVSPKSIIGCNTIKRMGCNIRCVGSMANTKILRNLVDTFYFGVRLDAALISNQGSSSNGISGQTYDNEWLTRMNTNLSKRVQGSVNGATSWYYKAGINFQLLSTQVQVRPSIYTAQITSTGCPTCASTPPITMVQTLSSFDLINNGTNSRATGYNFADDYFYQLYVYDEMLQNNNTDMRLSYSSTLADYYSNMQAGNMQKFKDVRNYISARSFKYAELLNNSIASEYSYDDYMKTVYSIYLNTWAKERFVFTVDEYNTLANIAAMSPQIGGPAKYTALVMVDSYNPATNERRSLIQEDNNAEVQDEDYFGNPYPNPAKDEINIDYAIKQDAELCIFDLSGKLIYKQTLLFTNNKIVINTNQLKQSVYFYKIFTNNNNIKTGKFILLN